MKNPYRGMFSEGEFDRPFFVSVVPPSGRRPWPIRTEAAERNYADGKPLAVQFTYPVHYVPAGKRSPRANRVQDRTAVLFRTAEPSELRTACVIRDVGSDDDITEIVHFEGELWWSLPGQPTIHRFAAALAAGEHAAVGLLDQGCVTTLKPASSEQELPIKKSIWNGRDNRLAGLGRGAERILVSGERVFLRDGAPLRVLWNGYRNQSITSVGISPVIGELASSRRNPAFEDASNELIFGRPFETGDHSRSCDVRNGESDSVRGECHDGNPAPGPSSTGSSEGAVGSNDRQAFAAARHPAPRRGRRKQTNSS